MENNIQWSDSLIHLDDGLTSRALSLVMKRYTTFKEKTYKTDFKYELLYELENLSITHDAKMSSSEYYYKTTKNNLENYFTYYVFDFTEFVICCKAITINAETKIDDTSEDIEDEYKIQELVIYYSNDISEKYNNIIIDFTEILQSYVYVDNEDNIFHTIGVSHYGGFELNPIKIKDLKIMDDNDITIHYGTEFVEEYNNIKQNLKEKNHGLILLHGEPGTGKTSIIRQLIAELSTDKEIIYLPSYMMENLASPEFIGFLNYHKNSIMILEDAELVLSKRDDDFGTQAVSNLLNIADGLLNDTLKIQVIATFNMPKKELDPALLRNGRLINEWEFSKLSIDDSQILLNHLKLDYNATEKMSLSSIYNIDDYIKDKNKMNKFNKSKKSKIGI